MLRTNKVVSWAMTLLLVLCFTSAALATEGELSFSPPELEPEEVIILPEASLPVYSLTFVDDDDTVLLQESLTEGDTIIEPSFIPERDGFFFLFWYDVNAFERTLSYDPFTFNGAIYQDVLLKALYEEIPVIIVEVDPPADPNTELHPDLSNLPETLENGSLVLEEFPQLGNVDVMLIEDPNGALKPEEEPEFSPVGNCGILIFSSHEDCMEEGAVIDLWAELIGFENLTANFQWQYSVDGGVTWIDVPGATGLTHSFIADPDTINWGWRLSATLEDI